MPCDASIEQQLAQPRRRSARTSTNSRSKGQLGVFVSRDTRVAKQDSRVVFVRAALEICFRVNPSNTMSYAVHAFRDGRA